MAKPERMVKVRILAPKNKLSFVINTLYDLGLCHITPHIKGKYDLDIGEPLVDAETISKLLVKIRSVLATYPQIQPQNRLPPLTKDTLEKAQQGIEKLYSDFHEIAHQRKELENNQERVQQIIEQQEQLAAFNIDIAQLQKSKKLCYFYGMVRENVQDRVISHIKHVSVVQKNNVLLVIGKKEQAEEIQSLLAQVSFTPIEITPLSKQELQQHYKEREEIKEKETSLQKQLTKIEKQLPIMKALEEQFEEEIRKQELPLSFAVTTKSFVAEGWIPQQDQKLLEQKLEQATKSVVHLEFKEPEKHDKVPVKMRNKRLITPFEFLLRLYNLPMYKELDPTSLVFITFPLFFGFMLGDVGYGLILMGVFYFLKKKVPAAKELASILLFAALVSTLFGFVYGEYLGFEHLSVGTGEKLCDGIGLCLEKVTQTSHGVTETYYDFPRLFDRVHSHINIFGYEILTVLAVAAIIGFIHLNLGFIIGFINEYLNHDFKHALYAKGSWIIMEIGSIVAILSSLSILSPIMLPFGIGIALLGIILLGIGEGVQGIVEIPALLSNTLSYMRLGAVGLASVGLAIVVNENLGLPMIERGGIFIVIGILIMIAGHTVNILLGVIGPFLHGIRLHYVEFFSKFFHGGGEEYSPFAKKTKKEHTQL